MAELPVPVDTYFRNFSFDVSSFTLNRGKVAVATCDGLTNKDEFGVYIGFKLPCDVRVGDVITDYEDHLTVIDVRVDTYRGIPAMFKAYY